MSTDNPWQSPETGPAKVDPATEPVRKPRTRTYVLIGILAVFSLIPPMTIVGVVCLMVGVWVWIAGYSREKNQLKREPSPDWQPMRPLLAVLAIPSALAAGGAVMLGSCNVTLWAGGMPLAWLFADKEGSLEALSFSFMMCALIGVLAGIVSAGYLIAGHFRRNDVGNSDHAVSHPTDAEVMLISPDRPINSTDQETGDGKGSGKK